MGYLDYIDTPFTKPSKASLTGKATRLLTAKGKKIKRRRGSGIKKKTRKQEEHRKLMEQYRKQKQARAQMFKDFKRLISND